MISKYPCYLQLFLIFIAKILCSLQCYNLLSLLFTKTIFQNNWIDIFILSSFFINCRCGLDDVIVVAYVRAGWYLCLPLKPSLKQPCFFRTNVYLIDIYVPMTRP